MSLILSFSSIIEEDEDFFCDADEGDLSEQGQVCART